MEDTKERGILFSGPMINPILADAKTQTRRILKLPLWATAALGDERAVFEINEMAKRGDRPCLALFDDGRPIRKFSCPYGGPGDRLWVRETWRPVMESWRSYVEFSAGGTKDGIDRSVMTGLSKAALRFPGARADINSENWHPAIHMPRWASRITLEVVSVRVERLQSISEADAKAEGVTPSVETSTDGLTMGTAYGGFAKLWESINGAESWDANPWVWVVTLKRVAS